MSKNKIVATVGGRPYSIIGTESEEYLFRVGSYVDRKIKEITTAYPCMSTTDAASLAAINIADELLKLRDERMAMDEKISEIIQSEQISHLAQHKESYPPNNRQKRTY